ncbi:hypothetical protein HQ585_03900 [candidate division KSB1 bacterium]|nr:hypothetical protein [candidate division KSB1 bacterium]
MKRLILFLLLLLFASQGFTTDLIVTKENKKFKGQVVKVIDGKYIVKTTSGTTLAIPKSHVARIYRGNRLVDFEEGMTYLVEKRHPYLPFIVLSVASGAYSVNRYQEYNRRKKSYNNTLSEAQESGSEDDLQNLTDNSGKALAESIIFGLFSAGSIYFAVKPLEVRVPIGKISVGTAPNGVRLSLNF